ncbi:Eco57I restriction-modification methylase domain-containing protein [Endozoicomonas montiporae]|nr:DNA methyltransferase [Endozoicomonas montiporae]
MKLRDEIGRYWRIAQALWQEFEERRHRTDIHPMQMTRETWLEPLFTQVFGFVDLNEVGTVFQGERTFPIGFAAVKGVAPVVFASYQQELDSSHDQFGEENRKRSPYGLVQEYLNSTDECLWGLVTNGLQLRLVRDNPSLTRPAFIEVDLERIFTEELYSDFVACWLLIHRSRFQPKAGEPVSSCILEQWKTQSSEEGERARGLLRTGVKEALRALGTGFVAHPENRELREKLSSGELSRDAYFQQLLRLIYRCLFLFTTESRGLLHEPGTEEHIRQLYRDGYSIEQIRERALKQITKDKHSDLWQAMQVNFQCLSTGQQSLGLPALGGLFANDQCSDIDNAQLENRFLLKAIRQLAWFRNYKGILTRINYRDMDTEELGSVYESLLELIPVVRQGSPWRFGFLGDEEAASGSKGSARKLTGSYYTPDSLVQELIKSALLPVIADRLKAQPENPTEALLSIKVVDPACGSGHFLLAAARRIAAELAKYQSTSGQPTEQEYRHALREVVAHCIYGVDLNPLAVELCKTALWLEALEPGKPLGFLDAHIRCGNGLVGILDPAIMEDGIPKEAFKALTGDDKAVCTELNRINKDAAKGMAVAQRIIGADLATWEQMPEEDLEQIEAKRKAWQAAQHSREMEDARLKEDIFTAAFFAPKTEDLKSTVPTNLTLKQVINGTEIPTLVRDNIQELAKQHRFLHWPLAFPEVFGREEGRQGFDVVLGNPPWERIKLQEKEFFAPRSPEISDAKNAAARSRLITKLKSGSETEQAIFSEFMRAKQGAEATSAFARLSKRFPLTGKGDVNLYALFAETALDIRCEKGKAGIVLPLGIATDDSTKAFFAKLATTGQLEKLFSCYEIRKWFPGTDDRNPFCLLTIGSSNRALLLFRAENIEDFGVEEKRFSLTPEEFCKINPNTKNCPIFRSKADAELTKRIYEKAPVLIHEGTPLETEKNPWGIRFQAMFHMSNDSDLFHSLEQLRKIGAVPHKTGSAWWTFEKNNFIPLYEAKMVHHYDHRWATYELNGEGPRDCTLEEKQDSIYVNNPRYWVDHYQVALRASDSPSEVISAIKKDKRDEVDEALSFWLAGYCLKQGDQRSADQILERYSHDSSGLFANQQDYDRAKKLQTEYPLTADQFTAYQEESDKVVALHKLLISRLPKFALGWRAIGRSDDDRTAIASIIPMSAVGNSFPLSFVGRNISAKHLAALQGCVSSLCFDFVVRHKVGGANLNFFIIKQFPTLPPEVFSDKDLDYIAPKVLELNYTGHDMKAFAEALGYHGEPFKFNANRRHQLRSELDAYYAKLYGLTRDELRYILDPADVMGSDYPSETFRVLRNKEMKEFGEYRTQRLVLEAWDKLEQQELEQDVTAEPVMPDFVYPGDDPVQQAYCGLILSTIRQLSSVDKKVANDIARIVLDISHRETFLEDEEALPLPKALPARSAKYDFDRAITSLENQKLIRRSSGNNWAATDTQNNGTAIIPAGIEALIAQALRVNEAVEVFNQQTTTADSHDRKTRKSS